MKKCSKCGLEKPEDLDHFYKHHECRNGLSARCKSCDAQKEKLRKRTPEQLVYKLTYMQEYYQKNRVRILNRVGEYSRTQRTKINKYRREHLLKKRCEKWNISLVEYQKMVSAQDNRCAICFEKMKPPCFDHCHLTNKFRGLLCKKCNVGIGNLKDSVDIVHNAWQYLKRFSKAKR